MVPATGAEDGASSSSGIASASPGSSDPELRKAMELSKAAVPKTAEDEALELAIQTWQSHFAS